MDVSGVPHTAHIGDYSPLDAARLLGVSRGTIWNMIRDGKLPSYAPTGRNGVRRIRVEAIHAMRQGKDPHEAVRAADEASGEQLARARWVA